MIYHEDTIIKTKQHCCRQLYILREQKRNSKIELKIERPLIFDKGNIVTKWRKSFSINSAEKMQYHVQKYWTSVRISHYIQKA